VLTGTNSSGKSTLLQSILLLKQTLHKKGSEPCILLNGSLIELYKFTEILSYVEPAGFKKENNIVSFDIQIYDFKDTIDFGFPDDGNPDVAALDTSSPPIAAIHFQREAEKQSSMLDCIIKRHIEHGKSVYRIEIPDTSWVRLLEPCMAEKGDFNRFLPKKVETNYARVFADELIRFILDESSAIGEDAELSKYGFEAEPLCFPGYDYFGAGSIYKAFWKYLKQDIGTMINKNEFSNCFPERQDHNLDSLKESFSKMFAINTSIKEYLKIQILSARDAYRTGFEKIFRENLFEDNIYNAKDQAGLSLGSMDRAEIKKWQN
jgi:hypothetical protein